MPHPCICPWLSLIQSKLVAWKFEPFSQPVVINNVQRKVASYICIYNYVHEKLCSKYSENKNKNKIKTRKFHFVKILVSCLNQGTWLTINEVNKSCFCRTIDGVKLYNTWNGSKMLLDKPFLPALPRDFDGKTLRYRTIYMYIYTANLFRK